MSESQACLSARAALKGLETELFEYKAFYGMACASKAVSDIQLVRAKQTALKQKMDQASMNAWLSESEHLFGLRAQYEGQKELLISTGILRETRPGSELYAKGRPFCIDGIDGREYPLPTLEEVQRRMYEKRELLKIKSDQKFTRMILVPFAMKLEKLLQLDTAGGKKVFHFFNYDGEIDREMTDGEFVYGLGQTKIDLLTSEENNQGVVNGWQILFLQEDAEGVGIRPIDKADATAVLGKRRPRPAIRAGKSPDQCVEMFSQHEFDVDSPYYGEFGMTPESWIMASLYHTQATKKSMLDESNPSDGITKPMNLLFGSKNIALDDAPRYYRARWLLSRDYGDFRPCEASEAHPAVGVRTEVRI